MADNAMVRPPDPPDPVLRTGSSITPATSAASSTRRSATPASTGGRSDAGLRQLLLFAVFQSNISMLISTLNRVGESCTEMRNEDFVGGTSSRSSAGRRIA